MLAPVSDPDSAVPPYEQVAKMMRDEIAQGAMTGRIPSLHTIAEHHHVSHRVAARALEILKGEGMIIDVPGEGEFVRHPMGCLPILSRGLGGRDLRRQQFKRQNPGRGGVPGYRYRAILGDQDGGCHRPGRAPAVARHQIEQQLGDLAQRDSDFPFMLPQDRFLHGTPQVARVNPRHHDGRDRALDALEQIPAFTFECER